MLFKSCVCHAFASVHCCLVVTCSERTDILALVCDVSLFCCHFPMCNPGSGVVLDCIDYCISYFKYILLDFDVVITQKCLAHMEAS